MAGATFYDPNNGLLAVTPARLETGLREGPDGRRVGVATIRTASTTLTIHMNAEDAMRWSEIFRDLAARTASKLDIPVMGPASALGNGGKPHG